MLPKPIRERKKVVLQNCCSTQTYWEFFQKFCMLIFSFLSVKKKYFFEQKSFLFRFFAPSKARRTYGIRGSRAAYRGAPRMTQIFLLLLLQPVGSSMLCQEKRRQQEKITAIVNAAPFEAFEIFVKSGQRQKLMEFFR